MPALIHWDDVTAHRLEVGELCAHWQTLGATAGSVRVGLNRVRIEPNRRSTPVHVHGAEEEIFLVLERLGPELDGRADRRGLPWPADVSSTAPTPRRTR